mmetsp:Transcript_39638/g.65718  ORF Transcript_39638/g.65718 Transcript_39638/m.65718 type:complete len:87 (-) Transcript_39638:59-319(-)
MSSIQSGECMHFNLATRSLGLGSMVLHAAAARSGGAWDHRERIAHQQIRLVVARMSNHFVYWASNLLFLVISMLIQVVRKWHVTMK